MLVTLRGWKVFLCCSEVSLTSYRKGSGKRAAQRDSCMIYQTHSNCRLYLFYRDDLRNLIIKRIGSDNLLDKISFISKSEFFTAAVKSPEVRWLCYVQWFFFLFAFFYFLFRYLFLFCFCYCCAPVLHHASMFQVATGKLWEKKWHDFLTNMHKFTFQTLTLLMAEGRLTRQ